VMSDLFGHKWTSSHDYADNGSWATFLDDLTTLQFKAGIDALREWTGAWPPSATDFRNMCLGRSTGGEEQNTIAGMQAIQRREFPLMITKQPTQEERDYGTEQLAGLMGLFGTPSRATK